MDITNIPLTAGQIVSQCNEICFHNVSGNTGVLYVNDMPVKPGCIFSLGGHPGEVDQTIYNTRITGAVGTDYFYVVRKIDQQ